MKLVITLLITLVSLNVFAKIDDAERDQQFAAVKQARDILDPIIMNMPGFEGSMIGVCIIGSDEDPFKLPNDEFERIPMTNCLVYLTKDPNPKERVAAELANRGIFPQIQIRFQKPFGRMELQ